MTSFTILSSNSECCSSVDCGAGAVDARMSSIAVGDTCSCMIVSSCFGSTGGSVASIPELVDGVEFLLDIRGQKASLSAKILAMGEMGSELSEDIDVRSELEEAADEEE